VLFISYFLTTVLYHCGYGNHYWSRFVKKIVAKIVAKEIALKKKNRLKENGSVSVLGFLNKHSKKDLKHKKSNK
jgi:hypothetical protein